MPILGTLGQIEGWLGLNDDITEQVTAREKLRESQEQFRVLADLIPSLIWVADENAQVYFWNQAWYIYTGASESESLGLRAAEFIREDIREAALRIWGNAVASRTRFEMEFPLKGADGTYHWFLARAHPVFDANGEVLRWVGSMIDIQEQKEKIDSLERQRSTREQYVISLSHDLRNALGAGQTSFELLRSENNVEVKSQFESIVQNSFRKTERMVRDLLDANHLENGQTFLLKEKTRVRLDDFVSAVCASHRADSGLVKIAECEGVTVFWDQVEMTRVLDNLIDNARKYRSGGEVTVTGKSSGEFVELAVHNWGHSISELDKENLFRLFARSEADRRSDKIGWGIGLTLVKGIVEAHGGQVTVQSSPQMGTTFTCRVPVEGCIAASVEILGGADVRR